MKQERSGQERPGQTTHGMTNTPLYKHWVAMKIRVRDDFEKADRYAERGITICDEWRYDFRSFYRDMSPTWEPGLTLDRIDNDKGYYKENCKWSTGTEQMRNTERARLVDSPWGRIPLAEAAERSGIDRETIYSRIKAGTDPFRKNHVGRVSSRPKKSRPI